MALIPIGVGSAASSPSFRGEWESESLSYIEDFSSGFPSVFVVDDSHPSDSISTSATVVNVASAPSTHALRIFNYRDNTDYSIGVNLNLSDLNLPGEVTKVEFDFRRATTKTWSPSTFLVDGLVYDSETQSVAWTTKTFNVPSPESISWRIDAHQDGASTSANRESFITNLRIYTVSSPYMLSEFVMHAGRMWKAVSNNASGEPGVSGDWTEVPLEVANDASARLARLEQAVPSYIDGQVPSDAIPPYLVVDDATDPVALYLEDGVE